MKYVIKDNEEKDLYLLFEFIQIHILFICKIIIINLDINFIKLLIKGFLIMIYLIFI